MNRFKTLFHIEPQTHIHEKKERREAAVPLSNITGYFQETLNLYQKWSQVNQLIFEGVRS